MKPKVVGPKLTFSFSQSCQPLNDSVQSAHHSIKSTGSISQYIRTANQSILKSLTHRSSILVQHSLYRHNIHNFSNGTAQANVTINFITAEGETVTTTAKVGTTLLDVCLDNELEVEGACGGECCCSTCHIYLPQDLFDNLKEADEDELDMLDLAIAVKDTSRLGCQIKVDESFDGQTIELPKEVINNSPDN